MLVNLCFEGEVFKIILWHKKESKLDILNCKPISLLSVFSKIYEKLIYVRIYSYLDKNKVIYNKQFGFRSNYSLLDIGDYICWVFVDFEKAFDTVNLKILCDKLNHYGLRGNINKLIHQFSFQQKAIRLTKWFWIWNEKSDLWSSTGFFIRTTVIPDLYY